MAERTLDNEMYDNHGEIELGGSSNAYTAATGRQITGYFKGLRLCGKANHTNTGAATLNVNGLGAGAIRKLASTALVAGDMVSGQYYDFNYDATNGWFQLLNPSTVSAVAGFPISSSGDRWGVLPIVGTDGGSEMGRYIDFHDSDGDTSDNKGRIRSDDIGTSGQDLSWNPAAGADSGVLKRFVTARNSTLAQGDVLYYDGSNFVRLAPGTSGQFLQTNGAAANPAWATVSQVVTAVAQGSISSAATLDISLSTGDMYEIDLIDFLPASDNVSLLARFSQSGSFLAGASDYQWAYTGFAVRTTDNADSEITLADQWGNASGEDGRFSIRIYRPSVASFKKGMIWFGHWTSTATELLATHGGGTLLANTNAIDGVRFLFSTGNIASGYYAVRSYSFT